MRKFDQHLGIAAPLLRDNINTDAIIPSVEMKRVSKKGLSGGLFAAWRYTDRVARIPNPEFVLNQPAFHGASILLAGKNFGCGSSREHAVWALDEYGVRVIIAPSFGSIFYANCIANGLLPISLPADVVTEMADFSAQDPQNNRLLVDLQKRSVRLKQEVAFYFEIERTEAEMLLNGWDPVAMTLQLENLIETFRRSDMKTRPWIYLEKN